MEGALIFPFLLAVLMSLLVFSMGVYDRAVTMACLNRCLTRAAVTANLSVDWESGILDVDRQLERGLLYPVTGRNELEAQLEEKISSDIRNEFRFVTNISKIDVEVGFTRIRASLVPEIRRSLFTMFVPQPDKWEKTIRILHPEELVRAFGEVEALKEAPQEEELSPLLQQAGEIIFTDP